MSAPPRQYMFIGRADGATPQQYLNMFEGHPDGVAIFEHLAALFCSQSAFVPGGVEGGRQTDFNCGKRAVVEYIQMMCDRARNGDPNEEQES